MALMAYIGSVAAKGDVTDLFGLARGYKIAVVEVLESAEALASIEIPFRAGDFPENSTLAGSTSATIQCEIVDLLKEGEWRTNLLSTSMPDAASIGA